MSVLLADQPTVQPSFCEVVLATSDVNGASNVDGPGRAVAGVVSNHTIGAGELPVWLLAAFCSFHKSLVCTL